MKKLAFFVIATSLLFQSCSSKEDHPVYETYETAKLRNPELNEEQEEVPQQDPEALQPLHSFAALAENVTRYNGQWFSISYPDNFTASPASPVEVWEEYEFVNTDEAFFTSPDGAVEFFVFSPQWGGDPKDYLEVAAHEQLVSDKEEAEEVMPENIHRWVTVEDAKGDYTRSFYSKKTESTHLVFGIKYTSEAAYEHYKETYKAFKKSLEQYAD